MLGEEAQSHADFEEDREDSIDDDEEDPLEEELDGSLSYTKTNASAILK